MNTKDILRKKAKAIRKTLDIPDISEKICTLIENSDLFKNSTNIMIFYPLNYEIDLTSLLTHAGKNFFLPKVNGKKLDICYYELGDELDFSEFNTLEPKTEPITNTDIIDAIFIPALFADKKGFRLGYGGGFYDRLLKTFSSNTKKIIVISNALLTESLPTEEFDQCADYIINEKEIIKINLT